MTKDMALPAGRAVVNGAASVSAVPASVPSADLDAAIRIMLDAHRGQVDKGGQPYYLHPLRVMLACRENDERIAAVLHDTVEDSALTFTDIRHMFGDTIMEAVQALTRCDGEDYADFIQRCAKNPIARRVKLADLADNMDASRLGREMTNADIKRMSKYARAQNVLMAAWLTPTEPTPQPSA